MLAVLQLSNLPVKVINAGIVKGSVGLGTLCGNPKTCLNKDDCVRLTGVNPFDNFLILFHGAIHAEDQFVDTQHNINLAEFFLIHQRGQAIVIHDIIEYGEYTHAVGGKKGGTGEVRVFLQTHRAGIADEQCIFKIPFWGGAKLQGQGFCRRSFGRYGFRRHRHRGYFLSHRRYSGSIGVAIAEGDAVGAEKHHKKHHKYGS